MLVGILGEESTRGPLKGGATRNRTSTTVHSKQPWGHLQTRPVQGGGAVLTLSCAELVMEGLAFQKIYPEILRPLIQGFPLQNSQNSTPNWDGLLSVLGAWLTPPPAKITNNYTITPHNNPLPLTALTPLIDSGNHRRYHYRSTETSDGRCNFLWEVISCLSGVCFVQTETCGISPTILKTHYENFVTS